MKIPLGAAIIFLAAALPAFAAQDTKPFTFYCDFYEGYDNNVNLDSSRKGDLFSEVDMKAAYRRPIAGDLNVALDYYLASATYYRITDASFYDNNISLNFDSDLVNEKTNLAFNNTVEYNYYPHEDISTYLAYNPQLSLRYSFSESAFHRLTYNVFLRKYDERKAEDGSGNKKGGDRQDVRNGVLYELAGLVVRDIFFKLKNEFYVNDSNDQYMDYYDYWSYRLTLQAIVPLYRERFFALLGAGYQRFDYKTRQLVSDRGKKEKDGLYSISGSLVFDITKRASLSLNYAYRQNESNEPSQEYSGSVMSAGFHYAF